MFLFGTIYLLLQDPVQSDNFYYYYNDTIVTSIKGIYIVLLTIVSLVFIYKILFKLRLVKYDIPKVNNLILIVLSGFVIALLVWYEFYYVTLFYRGDAKVLSGYIIGSSILLAISITILLSNKFRDITILFGIFAMLSYFFYECQIVILDKYIDIMNINF
jgi:hypothetical protein